jgi:hypothetical protein
VSVEDSEFHHGGEPSLLPDSPFSLLTDLVLTGNFQAMAVTNTMEKTRLGLAQIGKLSFSQLTELVNVSMNRGLPSCLAGSDPSLNYHVKGLDIAAAAYCSELGALANPVVRPFFSFPFFLLPILTLLASTVDARPVRRAGQPSRQLARSHLGSSY